MILGINEYGSIFRFLSILDLHIDLNPPLYQTKFYKIKSDIFKIRKRLGRGLMHRSEPDRRNITLCRKFYYNRNNLTKRRPKVTCPYCDYIISMAKKRGRHGLWLSRNQRIL